MDVKPGLCWRCEKLVTKKVLCADCKIAVYCSSECLNIDLARHTSVECKMWFKKCDECGNTGKRMTCTYCYAAGYCDTDCQEKALKKHKKECNKWQQKVKDVAEARKSIRQKNTDKLEENTSLYYFGNQTAVDLLGLPREHMASSPNGTSNKMDRDINLLLAGCGDVRNAIQTIYCVPEGYDGKLRFHLNDIDRFVMARNVLFLSMTAAGIDTVDIATIWLSTQISKKCYECLINQLHNLISCDSKKLKDDTKNVVEVDDSTLSLLKGVWQGWEQLTCKKDSEYCIPLNEQRSYEIDCTKSLGHINKYPELVELRYKHSIQTWFKDGIIMSTYQSPEDLPFYNPTLTAQMSSKSQLFQYCMEGSCMPFKSWDFLEVLKCVNSESESVTELIHLYLSKCLKKTQNVVKNARLVFEISVYSFEKLKDKLPKKKWHFDRIFTSNLADYYGMVHILKSLGSLLNTTNQNATLFVCYMNWFHKVNGGMVLEQDERMKKAKKFSAMKDLGISLDEVEKLPDRYTEEYNFTMPHFINFLLGDYLSFDESFQLQKPDSRNESSQSREPKLPQWSQVTQHNSLRMRDFRKEPNKIIPFISRINARRVTLKRGLERYLEWYIPPPPKKND